MINFNTGNYQKGKLNKKRTDIVVIYLKNDFFFDLISLLGLIAELYLFLMKKKQISNLKWLSILIYIRIKNFLIIFSKIGI